MALSRRSIVLFTVALVSLLLTFSRSDQSVSGVFYTATPKANIAPAINPTFVPPQTLIPGNSTTISGILSVVTGDPKPGSGTSAKIRSFVHDSTGKTYEVQLDPDVAMVNLDKQVSVRGNLITSSQPGTAGTIQQASLTASSNGPAKLLGSQAYINIACKFSDNAAEPQNVTYLNGTMANTFPRVDHYYRQASYTQLNFAGTSTVTHWYTLPSPRSTYVTGTPPNEVANLSTLFTDCTAAANADVNFASYVGINTFFNDNLDGGAWGGTRFTTLDGATRSWGVTWMPPWGWQDSGVLAHEVGHSLGLPHSASQYVDITSNPYDSHYDVMSSPQVCRIVDQSYGCGGPGLISYDLNLLGWIAASRITTVNVGTSATVTLERLQLPVSATNKLMVKIPYGGAGRYYTVEVRQRIAGNYDDNVPGYGVVIHEVNPARGAHPAHLMDADNDGDPNDDGSRFNTKEQFYDGPNNILVTVLSEAATSITVKVDNGTPPATYIPTTIPTIPPTIAPTVPINNEPTGAIRVNTMPFALVQSNVALATTGASDPDIPWCASIGTNYTNSVWYVYKPTTSGTVVIDALGSSYDFLYVFFTGTATSLSVFSCAWGSSSTRTVTAGTDYFFMIANRSATPLTSPSTLKMSFSAGPVASVSTRIVNSLNDVVDTACDATHCSLREAITLVPPKDLRVNFAAGLTGTITLTSPITIAKRVFINGPNATTLIISGGGATQLFTVNANAALTISKVTISGANAAGSYGAAIRNLGILALTTVSMVNNTAGTVGGAIYNTGTANISGSTFSGNTATNGTVLHNVNGTVTISNSTLTGSTGTGSAIYSSGAGSVTLINDTIAGNAGIGLNNASGTMTLTNTIVANNTVKNCGGTITDGGNNLQYPGSLCGSTIPTGDPVLGPLQSNGGQTQTMRPLANSLAVEGGNNSVCAASPILNLDQRGIARPIDGNSNGISTCDIGAYEAPIGTTTQNLKLPIPESAAAAVSQNAESAQFWAPESGSATAVPTFQPN